MTKCGEHPNGHEGCIKELFLEDDNSTPCVTVSYEVCPTHGRIDAQADIDD